jgi:hypothetical protein
LNALGDWFASQVETRPRTDSELAEIKAGSEFGIGGSKSELTNRTLSLAMDVGMYLGEVMTARHPKLTWEQPLDDPAFIDYGRPVLSGFGGTMFNPVRIVVTFAYGVAAGRRTGSRLREVYDVWSARAAKAGN